MSVTVEQRLREMSIVSTMLRAAMADDGSGDDEIKEEYDNQVDEDLAMLKEKLIKARRSEGKEPLDTENDMDLPESIEEAGSVVEATGLETKLVASEERVGLSASLLSWYCWLIRSTDHRTRKRTQCHPCKAGKGDVS